MFDKSGISTMFSFRSKFLHLKFLCATINFVLKLNPTIPYYAFSLEVAEGTRRIVSVFTQH